MLLIYWALAQSFYIVINDDIEEVLQLRFTTELWYITAIIRAVKRDFAEFTMFREGPYYH